LTKGKTMGTDNLLFLESFERFDETGKELVHRLPEKGSPVTVIAIAVLCD